ncbi:unnamed protein product [Malassezia sympodialis ATCC 42132]|uniref:uncharacterized protein n=1 Tax=Malassezia sympodialis (strain ATCC 42132) TaxID=1230383 RepID=UPI0002C1B17B|nr:uncharacterized protein MSY001_1359 [Malassezia sympodialis ATCC 42132]CCU98653.1 unnamed protein product [Malassezia sympodialis ATCC 42132]|eukprot:XP_018739946.1 uncharacterized protein MSY001_1359 [Malassezia sympodialis ATCC 42132]
MQAAAPSPEVQAEGLVARYLTPTTDDAPCTWTEEYANDVAQRRKFAVGGLFVDRWLQDAGLPATLFPPRALPDVFVLVVEILSCKAPVALRHALLLYLALEQATTPSSLPDAAHTLAQSLAMPPTDVQDVRASWAIDHGHLEVRAARSPQYALHIRRDSTYTPMALERLADAPKLLLTFVQLNHNLPPLDGPLNEAALRPHAIFVGALAQVEGLVPAWHACRALLETQPAQDVPTAREHLLGALLRLCFAPPQPALIRSLLLLPLHSDEEAFFEAWVQTHLSRASTAVALDTLLIKWVNQGRYVDAIHLERRTSQLERTAEPASETQQRARQRRRTMMDGVWALLPAIQRDALREDAAGSVPMDEATSEEPVTTAPVPPPRPHTPLSVSLSADMAHRAASPDARLLRTSIRMPTAASSQRGTASPVARPISHESPFCSSSPFSGWKRPGPGPVLNLSSSPSWGVPVPATAQEASIEDVAPALAATDSAAPISSSQNEWMPTEEAGPASQGESTSMMAEEETPASAPVRRRGGQRSAAKRAAAALRKALRPEEVAPTIPGGFPMDTEPSLPPPRRTAPRRSGRRSRATTPADDAMGITSSLSMEPISDAKGPEVRIDETAYPQASLARLQALHDTRPIARRTRAQTMELESQGSTGSAEAEPVEDAEETSGRTRRRTRERGSPPPATPHRNTRSARRGRRGSTVTPSTPRSTGGRR